jgi:hypothetical protein
VIFAIEAYLGRRTVYVIPTDLNAHPAFATVAVFAVLVLFATEIDAVTINTSISFVAIIVILARRHTPVTNADIAIWTI